MLKAKLDAARKNKKGFSLVELIIVMAIMVALIAVLAPQFVKYVQRARDSSVTDAADNAFAVVKSEWALGNLSFNSATTSSGTIQIQAAKGNGKVILIATGLKYTSEVTDGTLDKVCGIDPKTVDSDKCYKITITETNGLPTFTMTDKNVTLDTTQEASNI